MCATQNGPRGRARKLAALLFGPCWLFNRIRSSSAVEPQHDAPAPGAAPAEGVSGAVKDVAKDVAEDAAENLLESGGTALQAGSLAAWGSGLWAVLSLLLVALGAKAVAAALRQRRTGGGRMRLLDLLPLVVLLAGGLVVAARKGLVPALVAIGAAIAFGADAILKAIHARRAHANESHTAPKMTHRSGARLGHLRWPRSRRAHPCTVAAGSDAPPVRTAHLRGRRSLARTPSRA